MQIARIDGCTRTLGKAQGYLGLPLRDEVVQCAVNGPTPAMTTAWEPTPAELAAIAAGAKIHVHLLGNQHPPIIVTVGEPPG